MLERLLQLVAEGGIKSSQELAHRLSIPQPLLEATLEDLARRGYLHPLDPGCASSCAGCSEPACGLARRARTWALTEKGARAARQP